MSERQLIRVGHSPDPDDAFMFYALANDKIRHRRSASSSTNCKTSRRSIAGPQRRTGSDGRQHPRLRFLLDKYALLPSGCSMGDRYGPMVVARKPMADRRSANVKIAVPGTLTTAFLTLQCC